ncbi:beta-lactamase/transpeptidase-like protein [Mollisia scopiformis]|uniref:Beta-lactamase/transpeptidase-like protein n=1 Tax=Mollisia scopiformis TaxID=149040 RepID=A0A132B645_MOLSC|nr:beta-lactamase/transpeptidase-like protein [Mollisia scopiformis]KUJ07886.1 beta-lactamase/transpeptidase-like protein [Mollisia scopiformis]
MEISTRLNRLQPLLEELFDLSSSPGISIGVLHEDVPAWTIHLGRRRISEPTPPDNDTLYNVASITKLMTAGVVANLVAKGLLDWDTPIREYLSEFGERRDEVGQNATITDLLSNRTGLSAQNTFWGVMKEDIFPGAEQIPRMACHIPAIGKFRESFIYSSWGYGLVTSAIERVTGKPFSACVEEYIFRPLGMVRSTTNLPQSDKVVFKHWVGIDGIAHEFPWSTYRGWSDETGFGGAVGARTTFTGYNGSMILDPQSQTAIVVLVNSLPLFDITDVAGQLILGAILEETNPPDYTSLSKSVRHVNTLLYDAYTAGLEKKKTEVPTQFPLKHYEGEYFDKARIICYSVCVYGDRQLQVRVKGSSLTCYILESWGGELFCLRPDREGELSQSMWPFTSLKSRMFMFNCSPEEVLSFTWHHDITPGSKPETFTKDSQKSIARL